MHTALNQAITEKADASALLNEVTRATDAESSLRAAIATKADADKYLPLTGGTMNGGIISPSYKKVGGTDEQILLADGSIATAIDTDTLNSILN